MPGCADCTAAQQLLLEHSEGGSLLEWVFSTDSIGEDSAQRGWLLQYKGDPRPYPLSPSAAVMVACMASPSATPSTKYCESPKLVLFIHHNASAGALP
jgi:hypothetical protein